MRCKFRNPALLRVPHGDCETLDGPQVAREILVNGCGDEHLFSLSCKVHELFAALGIQLSEDIIKDEDRIGAVLAQQIEFR